MIDVGDAENPPNRQLLGSDAYIAIRNAMAERMRMNHILPAMNNSHRFRQRKMIRRAEDQSLRTGCPSSRTTSVSSIDSADRCDYEKGMRKLRTKSATTTVRNLDLRIPFAAGTQACVHANRTNPIGLGLRTEVVSCSLRDRPEGRGHKGVNREEEP